MKKKKKIIEVFGYIEKDLGSDNPTLSAISDRAISDDQECKTHGLDIIRTAISDRPWTTNKDAPEIGGTQEQEELHDTTNTINDLIKAYVTFVREKNKHLKQSE